MSIVHVWTDSDGTLYRQPDELRVLIEEKICVTLAQRFKKHIDLVTKEYCARREEKGSNTAALISYGFSEKEARELYNSVSVFPYVKKDERLASIVMGLWEKNIDLSIFTNSKRSKLLGILERLGVDTDLFRFLMTAEEVASKPSVEGFREILTRSKCDPSNILYVGNSFKADIVPATQMGMNTLLIGAEASAPGFNEFHRTVHYSSGSIHGLEQVVKDLNIRQNNFTRAL